MKMGIPWIFMITQIINYLLGPLGRSVLAFYTENSAIINGLIVLYGLALFLCNRNFLAIKKQAKSTLSKISKKDLAKVTWGDVLVPTGKIQLVANIKSWIPKKASATNLERLFPIKSLIEEYQNELKQPTVNPSK